MPLISNITFNGKDSFDYFSAALFNNSLLSEFQIYDSQQNTLRIPRVTLAGHVIPDSCEFGATGSITLDPVNLEVCAFKVNEKICRSEVEPTYLSNRLRAGSNNEPAPQDFANFILGELSGQIGNKMQNVLWNGNSATYSGSYLGECDGILVQALADATVVDVSATASITTANVAGELGRVYLAMADTVKSSGKVWKIYAAQNIVDAYIIAQGNLAYGLDSASLKELRYAGIPLVAAPYMPAGKMFATAVDNIAIGVDLMGDMNQVSVIDTMATLGENAYRIVARWKFGVAIKVGAETVLYY